MDSWELPDAPRLRKSVLVIPEKREVIINVESQGYMFLTPQPLKTT